MHPTAQGIGNKQDHTLHSANCLIARLTSVVGVVADYHGHRILEHAHRHYEADVVRSFGRIAFEFY
jgi:hypothetical protein